MYALCIMQDTVEQSPRSNIPELSVSELAFSLKRTLEEGYARVRVRGELGRVTVPKSGHMYADLKDAEAVLNAICWKGTLSRLSVKPEEGLEVVCTGRITTYPARSSYQLIIESMELAGAGALLKMLEERKKKLTTEGLFAPERKKALPFLPEVIGVVTSPTGAVIRDILHRLQDRFPRRVLLWPVLVQGPGAAEQIAAAIKGFESLPSGDGFGSLPRPDVIIVARGGGSLEDLMPFNEEIVVRAAAACTIPLISAVGHETDTTLIDYAADIRAPTPTAAAEIAVPRRFDLWTQITESARRLSGAMDRTATQKAQKLEHLGARLGTPQKLLEMQAQRLDLAAHRLGAAFGKMLDRRQGRCAELGARLRHPQSLIEQKTRELAALTKTMPALIRRMVDDRAERLNRVWLIVKHTSYQETLKRGFALIRDEADKPVIAAAAARAGQNISIEFHDGRKKAVIGDK